jgi:alkylhydroperoxidase/carboxymuconolactone decarboxylase family protein YurZ
MRNLRSLMIIGVILGCLTGAIIGCQTLKNAFCSPTAQEVADAANYVANAESILAFLSTLAPSAEVSAVIAAIKIAKAVFDQVKAGICVSAAQEQAAQTALQAGQTMAMKYGYRP